MLLNIINFFLWITSIVLLVLSFSTGKWYKLWLFEIIGSGYLWFAGLTSILLLTLLLKFSRSQRKLIIVLAIALGFYGSTILSWYVPRLRDTRTGGIPLTVMTYNVNYLLWDTRAVAERVRANPVDIFGLVEPFKEQAAALRDGVEDLYPYYYRATGGGLSLFSRYPIVETKTENLGTRYHSLFAIVIVGDKRLRVVVTHPLAPVSKQNFIRRNQTITALADYAAQQQLTTIIMGDFNTTSWSIYFYHFIQRSGLRSVNLGHGINPTWFYQDWRQTHFPSGWLKQCLKIPIDHIFTSQDVSVDRVDTLSAGVSDHRPILAHLRML
ncbi:MAG: endonuclease/exonuclease/phosphatase family protein [Microcoleaceae cyanobacterium]